MIIHFLTFSPKHFFFKSYLFIKFLFQVFELSFIHPGDHCGFPALGVHGCGTSRPVPVQSGHGVGLLQLAVELLFLQLQGPDFYAQLLIGLNFLEFKIMLICLFLLKDAILECNCSYSVTIFRISLHIHYKNFNFRPLHSNI